MASLHTASIGKVESVAAGATYEFRWNNPPSHRMLHYFAFPDPPHMPGQHGSSSGAVEITGVRVFHHDPNDAVSKTHVIVRVKNVGNSPTGFELFQTWVE